VLFSTHLILLELELFAYALQQLESQGIMSTAPAEGKLWGKGRFTGATDPLMHAFNQSLSYDKRMWKADLVGSQAYAKGLVKAGVLTEEEQKVRL
jgi:hypothetical protein